MAVIGISCFYHDSAAVCLNDAGEIISAVQEERFTRVRHDKSFPSLSVKYCLEELNKQDETLDAIVFYENPLIKFERLVRSSVQLGKSGKKEFEKTMNKWLGGHLYQVNELSDKILTLLPDFDIENNLYFIEHHAAHAASAFFPSPFENAAILTLDGVGELSTASMGTAKQNKIQLTKEMHFPNSLGLLYSAFTYHTGFKVNSGEYKMMGLAPYGKPVYVDQIKNNFIDIKDDGSFLINQEYFNYFSKDVIINEKFDEALGVPRRKDSDVMQPVYADVAASIQLVIEEVLIKTIKMLKRETGCNNICFAGGVALNSVANGKVAKECNLDGFWIQPAAGDAGGALGAAYYYHYQIKQNKRYIPKSNDQMQGALLGPEYNSTEVKNALDKLGAEYQFIGLEKIAEQVSKLIANGNTVAWFQGRMEYGPRALGCRSILADPRNPEMQKKLNLKVKKRESFRPFAPSVLVEEYKNWFELNLESPYMLFVDKVSNDKLIQHQGLNLSDIFSAQKHSLIPAVTHVDNSARVQTVDAVTNPLYHELINSFFKITGCPLLVNTSFNVRGEPIVCTPEDAFKCFINTELDYLAIGPYLLKLQEQDQLTIWRYKQSFKPD